MNFAKLDDELSVAPQITPQDVSEIAELGYKTIICNRPDYEQADQPEFKAIEAAARENNIDIIYQPIVGGKLGLKDAEEFLNILNNAQKPVFAYCRTGTRCITMWSLAQREQGRDINEIAVKAASHGYDVSGALANL
jgi:sulfide:quinone oxidoreductase